MFTKNINFKNFKLQNTNKKIIKLLDNLIKEKSEILKSLSKNYEDSFKKKNYLN